MSSAARWSASLSVKSLVTRLAALKASYGALLPAAALDTIEATVRSIAELDARLARLEAKEGGGHG